MQIDEQYTRLSLYILEQERGSLLAWGKFSEIE